MCVIAGYVGPKDAAPILIDMLRKEEGIAGGFYTGIVTIHEGKLYHDKVVGDLDTFLAQTKAREFPGTIGLIHSRTASGGGREWAHPFIDTHGKLAYIANGAKGLYDGKVDFVPVVERLVNKGYRFSSEEQGAISKYPVLPNGNCIHFSDILCQAISAAYAEEEEGELRLLNAMASAYQELPSAIVGLCLHADRPDEIVGARHNKPLEIARLKDGSMVMASSTIAFPDGVVWQTGCPAATGIRIERNGNVTMTPFTSENLIPVGRYPSAQAITEKVVGQLQQKGRMTMTEFIAAAVGLWPSGVLDERQVTTYNLMHDLYEEGKIELRNEPVPGVGGVGTAPLTVLYWKG